MSTKAELQAEVDRLRAELAEAQLPAQARRHLAKLEAAMAPYEERLANREDVKAADTTAYAGLLKQHGHVTGVLKLSTAPRAEKPKPAATTTAADPATLSNILTLKQRSMNQ